MSARRISSAPILPCAWQTAALCSGIRCQWLWDGLNAVFLKCLLHGDQNGAANHEVFARFRLEFGPYDQRAVLNLGNSLALEWLEQISSKFRVGRNILADLLENLADLVDIGVECAKGQFLDHPVAAEILDFANRAIGNCRQRTALMAQGNRPDRNFSTVRFAPDVSLYSTHP